MECGTQIRGWRQRGLVPGELALEGVRQRLRGEANCRFTVLLTKKEPLYRCVLEVIHWNIMKRDLFHLIMCHLGGQALKLRVMSRD